MGVPAYLTTASRTGTTLRIDSKDPANGRYSLFVHRQTDLIATFAAVHGDRFLVEGTRAVHFDVGALQPAEPPRELIGLPLIYKLRKAAENHKRTIH